MESGLIEIPEGPGAFYLRLAAGIRTSIQSGRLRPGDRLPSTRRLADQFGVHRHTISAGLDEVVAEGWLVARRGSGYQVVADLPGDLFGAHPAGRPEPRTCGVSPDAPGPPALFRFPSGLGESRLFPRAEYAGHLRRAVWPDGGIDPLVVRDPAGHPKLRAVLTDLLRHRRGLVDADPFVTAGAQEAIALCAGLLTGPGDRVAVEDHGYPPAWGAFEAHGAHLVGVRVDQQGVDPDSLESVLEDEPIRLLYLTPHHQYPTTVTLPLARRLRILELAERHDFWILEDDYDHDFRYRSRPIAPLKSRDRHDRVIYVSSLSKVLAPGIRLGFVIAPRRLRDLLVDRRTVHAGAGDPVPQAAVARWIRDGGFERHVRRMRRAYAARCAAMITALQKGSRHHGIPICFEPPAGGMSLWVDFGVESERLARAARARRVEVRSSTALSLSGRPQTHLRLGFASSTEAEIDEGIDLLIEAAASCR